MFNKKKNVLYRFVHIYRFQLPVFKHCNCRRRWKESKGWLKSIRYDFKKMDLSFLQFSL